MDIVERLKKNCTCSEVGSTPCKFEEECETAFDGADEIERLREALADIANIVNPYEDGETMQEIARAALKERE